MAFRRACSYQATIKTPVDPSTYSAIAVTFKQGETVVQKTLSDLTLTATSVVVQLTQEETCAAFRQQILGVIRAELASQPANPQPLAVVPAEEDDTMLDNFLESAF